MKKLGSLILLASILWSCDSHKTSVDTDPPLGDIQVNGVSTIFSSEMGTVVNQPNGSTVTVGANIFETADGSYYTGMVQLVFDEFHSPGDIIASGIPMRYDSAGVYQGAFTSAGMFNIDFLTPEGAALSIKKGESVLVELASNITDPNYNFYELIAEKEIATGQVVSPGSEQVRFTGSGNRNNWVYRGIAPTPKPNPKRTEIEDELSSLDSEPIQPEEQLDNAYKIALEVNLEEYPELEGFEGVVWQYIGEENSSEDPESNSWIYKTNWSNIALEVSDGRYFLALTSSKKKFKTPVKPVFDKRDLKKAKRNYERLMNAYASTKKKKEKLERKLAKQSAVLRALVVSSAGLYNCDVVPRLSATQVEVKARYTCANQTEEPKAVYLVTRLNNAGNHVTLRHDPDQYGNLTIYPTCDNLILGIYPNGNVAVLPNTKLEGILIANNTDGNTLELETIATSVSSSKELDKLIQKYL